MKFFEELKKRNVYKAGVAYVVTGWLLLQIVDVVGPGFGWPESATALLTKILLVGLPIALVLAWLYELTPKGFKRTGAYQEETSDNKKAGRRLNYFIIGTLSIAVCFLLADKLFFSGNTSKMGAKDASMAILPFAYISENAEKAFIADGILTGVYDNLAQMNGLFITSTTSSFRYKDQSVDLKKISEDLNVNYILEGTIIYEKDRIKVSPRLIDASEDRLIWSGSYEEEYDQNTKGVLNIQQSISNQIVNELKLSIPLENKKLSAPNTESKKALELYMQAEEISKYRGSEDYEKAIALLNQALEIDPNYALAHAALVLAYGRYGNSIGLSRPEKEELLKPHMDRAMELAPDNGEVYRSKGFYEWEVNFDLEAAKTAYKRASELIPNKAEVYRQLYWLESGAERYRYLLKAYDLNPLEPMIAMQAGIYYCEVMDECEKSIPILERARQMDPDKKANIGVIATMWGRKPYGDVVKAFKVNYEVYKRHPLDWWTLERLTGTSLYLGIVPLAERLVQTLQTKYPNRGITFNATYALNAMKKRYRDNLSLTRLWRNEKNWNNYRAALFEINSLMALRDYEQAKSVVTSVMPELTQIEKFEKKENVEMGKANPRWVIRSCLIEYTLILRALEEQELADRYTDVLCDYASEQISNDPFLRRDEKNEIRQNCLLAKRNTKELVALLDKMYFEDKDRLAVDIHGVEYDFMEEDQSFQNLKARIEAYLEESRNEVIEYLKEEGDWDPAWDDELGIE